MHGNAAFSESQRNLAFECWAYLAGRNSRKAARLLDEPQYDEFFPDGRPAWQSIYYWSTTENWSERVNDQIMAIAGDHRLQTKLELHLGSKEAVEYLRDGVQKAIKYAADHPDGGEVVYRTTKDGSEEAFRIPPPVFLDKVLMDRSGYSPIGVKADLGHIEAPVQKLQLDAVSVSEMTIEQILEREERIKELARKHAQLPRRGSGAGGD
jgi:hypothetical protein